MISSGFGQSVRKLPKILGKMLFCETYLENSNINQKLLIWSQDKIIMKFGQQKCVSFILEKYTKTAENLRKSVIMRNFKVSNINRKLLIWS